MSRGQKKREYKISRPYHELGSLLQKKRLEKRITQRFVAGKLEYSSAQFISNFERGIACPPLKHLKVLISLYSLETDQVVKLILRAQREIMAKEIR